MPTICGVDFFKKSTIVRSDHEPPTVRVPGYPTELIRPVILRNGARLRIRPIRPDDEPRLKQLFERLSARTIYQRFLAPYHRLPAEWYHQFANVDYRARLALVADEKDARGTHIRAVARYESMETPGVAEIAITVEDAWQGRGLGGVLLDDLLRAAGARGIKSFTADLLTENRRMLRLLWRLGEIRRREASNGVLTVDFERRHAIEGCLLA